MRIFASDWVQKAMRMMGMKEDEVIESGMVSKQIEKAQRKVESHNFDIRKNLLDYDDVANDQRKVIYQQRNELLDTESVHEAIEGIREDVFVDVCRRFVPAGSIDEQWNIDGLEAALRDDFGVEVDLKALVESEEELDADGIARHVVRTADAHFQAREEAVGTEVMHGVERHIMLQVLDQCWKEHLAKMDYLRQGIHLRGYAQKQPKQEYKREAFELFSEMLERVKREVTMFLARVRIRSEEEMAAIEAEERRRAEAAAARMQFQHASAGGYSADEEAGEVERARAGGAGAAPVVRDAPKVGRNDPCPCGSGKKYKQCHGRLS